MNGIFKQIGNHNHQILRKHGNIPADVGKDLNGNAVFTCLLHIYRQDRVDRYILAVPHFAPNFIFVFHKVTQVCLYAFQIVVICQFQHNQVMMPPIVTSLAGSVQLPLFRIDLGKQEPVLPDDFPFGGGGGHTVDVGKNNRVHGHNGNTQENKGYKCRILKAGKPGGEHGGQNDGNEKDNIDTDQRLPAGGDIFGCGVAQGAYIAKKIGNHSGKKT